MSEQMTLFDGKTLNPIASVKEAMREATKTSQLSREQLVDAMNTLASAEGIPHRTGRANGITLDMLEKWLSASADHLMPWKLFPIFMKATGTLAPLMALAGCASAEIVTQEDANLLKWAKMERDVRKMKRNQKVLEQSLGK